MQMKADLVCPHYNLCSNGNSTAFLGDVLDVSHLIVPAAQPAGACKVTRSAYILKQVDVVPLLKLSNLCARQLKAMSRYLTNIAQFHVVHAESACACTKSCHFTVACHVEFATASCFASIVKVYACLVEKATVRAMG